MLLITIQVLCFITAHISLSCREAIGQSYRRFKELFAETCERASKALGFTKLLRKVSDIQGMLCMVFTGVFHHTHKL